MVMYDNEFKTMGNKIWTNDKIEPQHRRIFPLPHIIYCYYKWNILTLINYMTRVCRFCKGQTFRAWATFDHTQFGYNQFDSDLD